MNEASVFDKISEFLLYQIKVRNANCVVVGISGGIDSAVAAFVAARSLGPKKVFGLLIPDYAVTPTRDVKDGIEISKQLGINYKLIDITKGKKIILKGFPNHRLARGNFLVRLRMSILYYYAAAQRGLVLGTADKSELQLGYFTKHGDGGADIFPIADLYKTEIRQFAKYLGVPSKIIEKESSARIWKGQTAEGEIGVNYDKIDKILKNIQVETISSKSKLPKIENVEQEEIKLVVEWIENNRHKHELQIPICKLS